MTIAGIGRMIQHANIGGLLKFDVVASVE